MGRVTVKRPVLHIEDGETRRRPDTLAAEEPLEIRVAGRSLAVTMRTPGHDVELTHGFLLTEGVIGDREDVSTARYCDSVDDTGANTYNVLDVTLAPGVDPPAAGVERNFYTTSSCGVCGKASLDAVRLRTRFPPAADDIRVAAGTLYGLPAALRSAQRLFDATGGLHGAGLFTAEGEALVVREDVGRHNAVDKVVGAAARGKWPMGRRCCSCQAACLTRLWPRPPARASPRSPPSAPRPGWRSTPRANCACSWRGSSGTTE